MTVVKLHKRKGRVVRSHFRKSDSTITVYRMEDENGFGPFNSKKVKPKLNEEEFSTYKNIIDNYHKKVPTIGRIGGIKNYVFGYSDKNKFNKNLGKAGIKFLLSKGYKIKSFSAPVNSRTIGQGVVFKKINYDKGKTTQT